jgi:CubicO group peptidase (beta-lactamase class C family)
MKQGYFLKLVSLLCLMAFSGCNKEEPPGIQFDNFQEELDHLVESHVRMGAAVGVIDKSQNIHEFYFGSLSKTRETPPGSHSLFELGSITKSFTATLLAKMILDGNLKAMNKHPVVK